MSHYLRYSGIKSKNELEKYLLRDVDTWLTSEEALEFGIVDMVKPLKSVN